MKWILMIYIASSNSYAPAPSGFSVEFETLAACKSAYAKYAENRLGVGYGGSMTGICVPSK